jgi:tetratricopeptide (TPR) repeat protein
VLHIGQIFLRLINDPGFFDILGAAVQGNSRFLHDLAAALSAQGRHDDALEVCGLILHQAPDDPQAQLLRVRLLSAKGDVEAALSQLTQLRRAGAEVIAEMHQQAIAATAVYQTCIAAGDLARALNICELLVELCPGVFMFRRARQQTRDLIQRRQAEALLQRRHAEQARHLTWDYLNELESLARACHGRLELQAELEYRLEICRHPLDPLRHSAVRVSNISSALACVLAADVDVFDAARLALARELLDALAAMPVSPLAAETYAEDPPARWERQQRELLGTIDLDAIFGPAPLTPPPLSTSFVSSTGEPMALSDVIARGREVGARVMFATSASAEYFTRYARTYVASILKATDCNCLVFVCACVPKGQLAGLVRHLGIDDRRLILCSDDFDPQARDFQILSQNEGEPLHTAGIYYASSALLRMDCLLESLGLPICVTGIDTVLQRGVADLIETFAACDVVLNRLGASQLLGSQFVNNLVLTYPTANGLLFARFLQAYLGGHVARTVQASYLDQLDLHMAKHHLMARGAAPAIGYFAETDINNIMFNHDNFRFHRELMGSYRFLNMFIGGNEANPLTAADVVAEEPAMAAAD